MVGCNRLGVITMAKAKLVTVIIEMVTLVKTPGGYVGKGYLRCRWLGLVFVTLVKIHKYTSNWPL